MAVTADKVVVELELKDGQYLAKVRQAEAQFNRAQKGMANEAKNTERQIRASSGAIASSIRNMAAGIAAGASVVAIKNMGDAYTRMQNRLKVTGESAAGAADQFETLMGVAASSRSDIESIVQTYSRLTLATDGMGFSQKEVTRTTEILAKALKASGASAQETSAALLQFGQGVGAGALMGDELRSIRENAPLVARAIADEFNTTIGGLKKLGEEGKLTSDRVVKAVLASGQAIDSMWANTEATVQDALTQIGNNLIKYVGQVDNSIQGTERLTVALNGIANNLDVIIPSLGIVAALFGVKLVASMGASAAATVRQAAASALAAQNARAHAAAVEMQNAANARLVASGGAATAALRFQAATTLTATSAARGFGSGLVALAGGPISAAAIAVVGLSLGLAALYDKYRYHGQASQSSVKALSDLEKATEAYEDAVNAAAVATGKAAVEARKSASEKKKLAQAALESARAHLIEAQAVVDSINAQATAMMNAERLNIRGDRPGSVRTVGMDKEYADAAAGVKAASDVIVESQKRIADAEAELNKPANKITDDGDKGKGKKEKDRRAETLADLREQVAIEEAQLQGNEALVRALEQQAEERARIKQLVDAGFSQSQAEIYNEEIKAKLAKARADDMERLRQDDLSAHSLTLAQINGEIEIVRQLEREAELNELIEKHKKTTLSTEEAIVAANKEQSELNDARAFAAGQYLSTVQKTHSLRIAEILGDKERVKLLTDQEEITRRTNELRAQGLLDEKSARDLARTQVTTERAATEYASQREFFASTFSEGMRAAMAGDLKGFLSSQFGNIADQAFRKLGETLFDSFMNVPADIATAQIEGAAQGVAAGTAISTAMITSSVTAGTTIGGAMTAAGLTAAKAIAAAMASGEGSKSAFSFLSAFGGNRASGGPVRAGSAYTVGESGRETFVPSQNGYIIPNMQNVRANAGAPSMVKLIVDEGSMFQARVEQISGPIAVQAAVTSTSYSNTQAKTSQRRRQQSFV